MELIEFQECLDEESAEETVRVLEAGGIPFRRSTGRPAFDVSSLGGTSQTANKRIIISIPPQDYPRARSLMEAEALKLDPPKDHHLRIASEEELHEIVREADDWSPFDVAHARRILEEMGAEVEDPEVVAAKRQAKLAEGKEAPPLLMAAGFFLPVVGISTGITLLSLMGCGITLSVAFMKSKTVDGRFYTYNEKSRNLARFASVFAVALTLAGFYFWASLIRYGDFDLYVP
jgi:hypothetical protein